MTLSISRRQMTFATLAGSAISMIPGKVLGANERVNVACVGIGGRGTSLIQSLTPSGIANIVALCDVDMGSQWTSETESLFPEARKFQDFRVMFDKMEKEVDAVIVCVPDHSHFPITMAAMALGKHVYVEKPMARTFLEVELMMAAEQKYKVVTQMGNQGHSGANYFQFKAWKDAGIITDVTHVDAYMNKSRRWHSWGNVKRFPSGEIKPDTLDWDIWLGSAQPHDYSDKLHYGNWRGWYDFGTGCFGDWGAHILDTIHQFLDLGLPNQIRAKDIDGRNKLIYPTTSIINFDFPARGDMPAMDIDWYDGKGNKPRIPKEMGDRKFGEAGKFIYSKDTVFHGTSHSNPLQIIPYEKMRELLEAGELPRDFGKNSNHYANFLLSCRGDEQTRSPFSVAGPLSQTLALGCLAQRFGGMLKFDQKTKHITNNKLADSLLRVRPRKGWEQYYRL